MDTPEKNAPSTKRVFTLLIGVVGGLALGVVADALVVEAPKLSWLARSPDAKSECATIRSGMEFESVLKIVGSKAQPFDQTFRDNQLRFYRRARGEHGLMATCQVTFDPQSRSVSDVKFEVSTVTLVE